MASGRSGVAQNVECCVAAKIFQSAGTRCAVAVTHSVILRVVSGEFWAAQADATDAICLGEAPPSLGEVYPDPAAAFVRVLAGGREPFLAEWGCPLGQPFGYGAASACNYCRSRVDSASRGVNFHGCAAGGMGASELAAAVSGLFERSLAWRESGRAGLKRCCVVM